MFARYSLAGNDRQKCCGRGIFPGHFHQLRFIFALFTLASRGHTAHRYTVLCLWQARAGNQWTKTHARIWRTKQAVSVQRVSKGGKQNECKKRSESSQQSSPLEHCARLEEREQFRLDCKDKHGNSTSDELIVGVRGVLCVAWQEHGEHMYMWPVEDVGPLRIAPQSLFNGPRDQSTWMFPYNLIQEWSGRAFWYAVWRHYAKGLCWVDQHIKLNTQPLSKGTQKSRRHTYQRNCDSKLKEGPHCLSLQFTFEKLL